MSIDRMQGSGSPHAADARAILQEAFPDDMQAAIAHAVLAVADELAEGNRIRDDRERDRAEAVSDLAASMTPQDVTRRWAPEGILPKLLAALFAVIRKLPTWAHVLIAAGFVAFIAVMAS